MSPTGQTSSNANADDFSLGRDVYREREASFGTVDEAEENAATTSYEYRPPARETTARRLRFRFGRAFASRRRDCVGASREERRASLAQRASRTRGARVGGGASSFRDFETRELEEIEAPAAEQSAAKEARKVREAETRGAHGEQEAGAARAARARGFRAECETRGARTSPNNLCISLRLRVQRKRRGRRGTGTTRGFAAARRAARNGGVPVAGVVGHVQAAYERRRATEMYPDDARAIGSEAGSRLPAIRSSSSSGADLNPHRVKYGDRYHGGRRGATLPNLDEPRKSRFHPPPRGEGSRGATSTRRWRRGLSGTSPKTRAMPAGESVKELHRPRVSERARREVATRADAIRRGCRRSLPHRPARTGLPRRRTVDGMLCGRRVAAGSCRRAARSTSGPRPRANRCPRRGGGFRSGQRARARAEKQLRARRDDDAHYDGYDGVVGTTGTTVRRVRRLRPRGRLRGCVLPAGDGRRLRRSEGGARGLARERRVRRRRRIRSGRGGWGHRRGRPRALESEHLAPRARHLAPRESEHLAASLGGKGFAALRERQLAAVEARRAANADDGTRA